MKRFRILISLLLTCVFVLGVVPANAQQLVSTTASVALTYSVPESLSVSVSPTSLALTTSPQTLSVTATWNLAPSRVFVGVLAYFASTTALTNGSGGNINVSNIIATSVGNTAPSPCNGNAPAGFFSGLFNGLGTTGATCPIVFDNTTAAAGYSGSQTQQYQLNLLTAPTAFGSYTGSIIFVAAAV